MTQHLPFLAVVIAAASLALAAFTYRRAARWREDDDAQALIKRVTAVEQQQVEHGQQLKDIPSKADFAALRSDLRGFEREVRAELGGLERVIANTEAAVSRIEGFLMERSK